MNRMNRERLVRVLGLLGSAHDGESLSAAHQAEHLTKRNGAIRRDVPRLSAATIEKIIEAIRHAERGIALMQQVLDDDEAQSAVELSWSHAQPLH
jgi:hypothetical protein